MKYQAFTAFLFFCASAATAMAGPPDPKILLFSNRDPVPEQSTAAAGFPIPVSAPATVHVAAIRTAFNYPRLLDCELSNAPADTETQARAHCFGRDTVNRLRFLNSATNSDWNSMLAWNTARAGGNPLHTTFSWDFGDPNSANNRYDGFNAAHRYKTPGTYVITLTTTNEAGQISQAQAKVIVPESAGTAARRSIYIASNGSTNLSGGASPNDPVTFDTALSLIGSNVALLFKRGETHHYTRDASISLAYNNVLIDSYGSQTFDHNGYDNNKAVILWDNNFFDQGSPAFFTFRDATRNVDASNITIQNVAFSTKYQAPWSYGNLATQPAVTMFEMKGNATNNITLSNCDFGLDGGKFGSVIVAVDLVSQIFVEANRATNSQGRLGNFVYGNGKSWVVVDNQVGASSKEHGVRAARVLGLNVQRNLVREVNNTSEGGCGTAAQGFRDCTDGKGASIRVQRGAYAYIAKNFFYGNLELGPLFQGTVGDRISFHYGSVFEKNTIVNGSIAINSSAHSLRFKNNFMTVDQSNLSFLVPITVNAPSTLLGTRNSDIWIFNNTISDYRNGTRQYTGYSLPARQWPITVNVSSRFATQNPRIINNLVIAADCGQTGANCQSRTNSQVRIQGAAASFVERLENNAVVLTNSVDSAGLPIPSSSLNGLRTSRAPALFDRFDSVRPVPAVGTVGSVFLAPVVAPELRGLRVVDVNGQTLPSYSPSNPYLLPITRLVGNEALRFVADPGAGVASVKVKIDNRERIENAFPYSVFGDSFQGVNSRIDGEILEPGLHRIEVTPFSASNASGVAGLTVVSYIQVLSSPAVDGDFGA